MEDSENGPKPEGFPIGAIVLHRRFGGTRWRICGPVLWGDFYKAWSHKAERVDNPGDVVLLILDRLYQDNEAKP